VVPPLLYSRLSIKSSPESIIRTDNQYFSGLRKVSEQKTKGAHHVWQRILNQSQPTILKRSLTVRMRLTHLRRRILSQDPPVLEYLETSGSEPDMTIDAVDDRILRGINSYPKLSLRQVSAKIGIPHSTTNLRLKKMREAKILLGSIYGIYTNKLGLSTYRLLLKFRSRGSALDSLISKCIHENKGIYLSIVTFGEWDHEFVVEARSADEYGQTVRSVETIMSHVLEATESIELVAYTKVSDYFSPALQGF
jgi:DNA-binding Lrp family transcriptional regulator